MSVTDLRAEARADRAALAEQRRKDAEAADRRRADWQQEQDARQARLTAQRAEQKARRRSERAARRSTAFAPAHVYRTGTLALVVSSGLASLPAQVIHFTRISWMLLPLPLALEGAAWVMAAGVAFADARGLAGRVRWLLRLCVLLAAGFAAWINYGYGSHLAHLSPADRTTAGVGLAAVSLLGPLLFEVRQWVATLAAGEEAPTPREERRHTRLRRRHHRSVAKTADRLLSAAAWGSLTPEEAWERAWTIETGADEPGMTPELHRRSVASSAALAQALLPAPPKAISKHRKASEIVADRSPSDLQETTPGVPVESAARSAVVNLPKPVPVGFLKSTLIVKPHPTATPPVRAVATGAESARPRRATGRVPQSARTPRPKRTADDLLTEARKETADWSDAELTADRIRKAVRTSADKARTLRDTLRAERAATPGETAA
ncbi:hypothetical protein [Streptomyces sp. NRRL F-5630]|uniref:hypothetical protein n=1 Tax=Streptomyces sp. NRRL F-5630 TaxID=1463864 RepID=UPI003EBBB4D7